MTNKQSVTLQASIFCCKWLWSCSSQLNWQMFWYSWNIYDAYFFWWHTNTSSWQLNSCRLGRLGGAQDGQIPRAYWGLMGARGLRLPKSDRCQTGLGQATTNGSEYLCIQARQSPFKWKFKVDLSSLLPVPPTLNGQAICCRLYIMFSGMVLNI